MDYLLGSIGTIIVTLAILFFIRWASGNKKLYSVQYSQSYVYSLVRPLMSAEHSKVQVESQATKHYDEKYTKILIIKNKAYWIDDNSFYVADLDSDGNVDSNSAKLVDTMAMNKVQLNEAMLIVEELTRGKGYDSRDPGK